MVGCEGLAETSISFRATRPTHQLAADGFAVSGLRAGEIEKDTINRYLTLGINYWPNADWNLNMLVPYVSRSQTTYGTQLQPYTPAETAPDQMATAGLSYAL
jgi:hypothetical protein